MRRTIARLIRRYAGRAMRFADRVEFPDLTPAQVKRMRSYARAIRRAERTRIVEPIPAYSGFLASCRNCGCLSCARGDCGPVCTFGDW